MQVKEQPGETLKRVFFEDFLDGSLEFIEILKYYYNETSINLKSDIFSCFQKVSSAGNTSF